MARILVLTNDLDTVFDEGDVEVSDLRKEVSERNLLGRPERMVDAAEPECARTRPKIRRIAMIVPTSSYRDISPS